MKKIISFMLVLAMLLSVAYVQVFAQGDGRVEIGAEDTTVTVNGDVYTVCRTLEELPKTAVAGKKYILANDIDCGGSTLAQTTITLGDGDVLDGNGYGILNFKLDTSSDDKGKSGMIKMSHGGTYTIRNIHFGSADAPCEIQNNIAFRSNDSATTTTTWENVQVYMYHTRDGGNPGAFISTAKGTHTFKNCDVYFSSNAITTSTASNIGGFVGTTGDNTKLTFDGCNVYGDITSVNNIGGFIGYVDHEATISFKNCNNYANMTINGGNAVGGFIGYMRNAKAVVTYENCQNFGVLRATGASTNVKEGYVGGIVGYDCGKSTFKNCRNNAALSTYKTSGGIVGFATSEITLDGCFNKGNITVTVDTEKIGTGDANVGGIVGRAASATFTKCTNVATLTMTAPASDTVYGCGNLGGYVGTWSAKNCLGFGTLVGANADKGVLYGAVNDETGISNNNKFIMNSDNNENLKGAEGAGRVTAEGALESLAGEYSNEKFVLGDNGTPVVATPKLTAVQAGATDTTALRLVGAVDTVNFNKAGFKYTVTYKGESAPAVNDAVYTTKALGAIGGKEDNISLTITAEELGGAYLYTYTLTGLRAGVDATITVTPITVVNGVDGAEDTVYEGKTITIVYNSGEIISAS